MKIINASKSPQKPQILVQPGDVLDVPDHVAPYLTGFSPAFQVHEPQPAPAPPVEPDPDPDPPPVKKTAAKKTAAKKETD